MGEVTELSEQMQAMQLHTKQTSEGDKILQRRNLEIGDVTFPQMPPGTQCADKVAVQTNLFPIIMHKKIPLYQYHIEVSTIFPSKKTGVPVDRRFNLSAPLQNDAFAVAQSYKCMKVFQYTWNLCKSQGNQIPDIETCYFDLHNILYCTEKLKMDEGGFLLLKCENLKDGSFPLEGDFKSCEISLRSTNNVVTLGDIPVQKATFQDDKSFQVCLDIVTSQGVFFNLDNYAAYDNGASYPLNPGAYGFRPDDCPALSDGAYVSVGALKNVKIVSGRNGLKTALLVETKKTPFFNSEYLHERVLRSFPDLKDEKKTYNSNDILKVIKKIAVIPTHLPDASKRVFPIKGISSLNAKACTFEQNGRAISVADYFKSKYNRQLKFPELPLAISEDKLKNKSFHPLEVLLIADNQRLPNGQITPIQVSELIKVSAVPPRVVAQQILNSAGSLDLFNKRCERAGVEVVTKPIGAAGKILPPPCFVYKGNQVSNFDKAKMNWRAGRMYINPADIKVWAIYAFEMDQKFDNGSLRQFAEGFHGACTKRGIKIAAPADMRCLVYGSQSEDLKKVFQMAAEGRCQYMVFITTKSDPRPHGVMKLLEHKHGIVTQNITSMVAADAVGLRGPPKVLTMENLVNKANVKNGGLNYEIKDLACQKLLGQDDCFIGVATNHNAGGLNVLGSSDTPSVIGYAANDIAHSCAFTGDYMFQEPQPSEKFKIIESIIRIVLKRFVDNRGKNPKRVFLFRNQVAETQYEMVKKYEIPLINNVLKEYNTKLVYVVPNKMHHVRLLPQTINGTKPMEQNLPPGTIVDTEIVSPIISEFFCLGHAARMGTAKIPRYSILANDASVSMEELQAVTYYLSYGHQIITGATGLPSPVFIANRYAERGRLNYNTFITSHNGKDYIVPQKQGNGTGSSSDGSAEKTDTYKQLYDELAYYNNPLRDVRFNA